MSRAMRRMVRMVMRIARYVAVRRHPVKAVIFAIASYFEISAITCSVLC